MHTDNISESCFIQIKNLCRNKRSNSLRTVYHSASRTYATKIW